MTVDGEMTAANAAGGAGPRIETTVTVFRPPGTSRQAASFLAGAG